MKQKMRIKLCARCEKCMKKAMKLTVGEKGVTSVSMEGELKNEIVVVGEELDAISLVVALRKKICFATLQSLEEVKPNVANQKKPPDDEKPMTPHCCLARCPSLTYHQPRLEEYIVVHDSYGHTTGCSIM